MKMLSFAALAATLALSSFAHAGNGGAGLNRWYGDEGGGAQVEGFVGGEGFDVGPRGAPPIAGPIHRPGITRFDEPFDARDVFTFLPQAPTECKVVRVSPIQANIFIRPVNIPGPAYVWEGLADDHGKIDNRVEFLRSRHLCEAGVKVEVAPSPGVYGSELGY